MYFDNLKQILLKNNTHETRVSKIINPFSLFYICDHFYGDEIKVFNVPFSCDKHNILVTNDLSIIKDFDIIHVETGHFSYFCENVLDKIDHKFILTTGQWNGPQVHLSSLSEKILNHKNVILWISQNPIYENSTKYMAFPYGISIATLDEYVNVLLTHSNTVKSKNVSHLPCRISTIECRQKLPELIHLPPEDFYKNIAQTKFLLSPIGDRDDCYRHYEAIGLGCIPISNVSNLYKNIFEESMYYCDIDKMVDILNNNNSPIDYFEPNKDLICFDYYKDKVYNIINKLKNEKI